MKSWNLEDRIERVAARIASITPVQAADVLLAYSAPSQFAGREAAWFDVVVATTTDARYDWYTELDDVLGEAVLEVGDLIDDHLGVSALYPVLVRRLAAGLHERGEVTRAARIVAAVDDSPEPQFAVRTAVGWVWAALVDTEVHGAPTVRARLLSDWWEMVFADRLLD